MRACTPGARARVISAGPNKDREFFGCPLWQREQERENRRCGGFYRGFVLYDWLSIFCDRERLGFLAGELFSGDFYFRSWEREGMN